MFSDFKKTRFKLALRIFLIKAIEVIFKHFNRGFLYEGLKKSKEQ